MDKRGQTNFVPILQFPVVLLVMGILAFAFYPIIRTFWDLNTNTPGYDMANSILGLWPILWIIGAAVLYLITRPRQNPEGYG